MLNLFALNTWVDLIAKMLDHPFKLGVLGTGSGTMAMALSQKAEEAPPWEVFDQVVYRVGACAATLASILTVVLLIYRLLKARKETSESSNSDKHN